jgi:hypothetical protein
MEAAEGQKHHDVLFDFEVSRCHKGLHSKQTQNILNLEKAHHDQYEQFIQQWHNFQESFEDRVERAIISTKEHHSKALQHIEKNYQLRRERSLIYIPREESRNYARRKRSLRKKNTMERHKNSRRFQMQWKRRND